MCVSSLERGDLLKSLYVIQSRKGRPWSRLQKRRTAKSYCWLSWLLLVLFLWLLLFGWSNQFRRSSRARVYVILVGPSPFASARGTCSSGRHRWKGKYEYWSRSNRSWMVMKSPVDDPEPSLYKLQMVEPFEGASVSFRRRWHLMRPALLRSVSPILTMFHER